MQPLDAPLAKAVTLEDDGIRRQAGKKGERDGSMVAPEVSQGMVGGAAILAQLRCA